MTPEQEEHLHRVRRHVEVLRQTAENARLRALEEERKLNALETQYASA